MSSFNYADTVTITTNQCGMISAGAAGGDEIVELRFDLRGGQDVFCDFDCNVAGTPTTDAICLYKTY